ncbi:MAG: hypothetical protein ACFFKA_08160 [Candidatus Thorarchaeota archaeon]
MSKAKSLDNLQGCIMDPTELYLRPIFVIINISKMRSKEISENSFYNF